MKKIYLLLLFNSVISLAQTQIGGTINGLVANERMGTSVSLSGNGNIVAVASTSPEYSAGSVRVFQNNSGVWTQIGADINGVNSGDESGLGMSLSDDGTVLAVGAPFNDANATNSGHVRVYKNISNIWTQIGTDIYGETSDDYCGMSVSLSKDGTIIAVGAPGRNVLGDRGYVRIYRNVSNVWTQIGTNIDAEAIHDQSGYSVSLSDDGAVVAIGAPFNNGAAGHVRVYKNISNVWTQIGDDIDGEAAGDLSGLRVSLSGDGTVVAIGARDNDANGSGSGHVRVYRNISNVWTQIGADIDGVAAYDFSGFDTSLSNDGSIVAIGARTLSNGDGQVRVYKNVSNNWIKIGADINSIGAHDSNGWSIALSNNGSVVAIGASGGDINFMNSGYLRVFSLSTVLKTDDFVLQNFSVFPNPATDTIKITLQKKLILEKVNVYSALGQLVKSSSSSKISVKDLSKGIYYFEIITNKGKATKKIIVE